MTSVSTIGAVNVATPPSTTATTGGATSSVQLIGNNFNTFLKMLTTELTNQNPMSPMDTQQFTSQLVQFSEVEQLMNMSNNIQQSLQAQQSGNLLMASQMIGRTVSAQAPSITLSGGNASIAYTMPANIGAANLVISDSTGATVAQIPVPTNVGPNTFTWNGQTAQGTQLADGIYGAQVLATDGNGNKTQVPVVSQTTISGVQRNSDGSVSIVTPSGPVNLNNVTQLN
jgi:flagellar basal-body rod modification protein FlgD